MKVYCVKDPERGWLSTETTLQHSVSVRPGEVAEEGETISALNVFLKEADAFAASPAPECVVELPSADMITSALEDGRRRFVLVNLGDGEPDSLAGLSGWRALLEAVEEAVEKAVEERTRRYLTQAVMRGELEYDPEMGKYTRVK